MNFNKHSNLEGKHSFLSASSYSWIRYSDEKLKEAYLRGLAKQRGTELHDFASKCIKLGQKLPKSNKTLNRYVNDAIGYGMKPEVLLYFSENAFGTADAICFKNNMLRIHDLKTGYIPAHIEQLIVYAAYFCLEYHINPSTIEIELRIYQNDEVFVHNPEVDEIVPIMDKIKSFDKLIKEIKKEADVE